MLLEVSVESVRMSLMSQHRLIVLKEMDEERYLPIWIGPYEADAIAIELQSVQTPRPLAHDLLKQAILALGGRVSHVVVRALRDDTFYASVVLDQGGQELELDARPSDSIALAVRTKAKIFVDSAVMAQAGITKEEDVRQRKQRQGHTEDLEVFREFLEGLDLDTSEEKEE